MKSRRRKVRRLLTMDHADIADTTHEKQSSPQSVKSAYSIGGNHSRPQLTQLCSMRKHSSTAPRALARKTARTPSLPLAVPVPRWLRFAPLYIALAVLAVYFTAPGFHFIGFDDMEILKQRYFIIGDLSKIKLAFTTDAFLGTNTSFYRPLQTLSFMLDALVGGPKPFIYHLTNLLLHIAGSLCVFWLLVSLGYHRLSSLLLALLFALHPMFVPMVAWVPTRGDLLLTIFVIVSFVLFIKSFRGNRPAPGCLAQHYFFPRAPVEGNRRGLAGALPALLLFRAPQNEGAEIDQKLLRSVADRRRSVVLFALCSSCG